MLLFLWILNFEIAIAFHIYWFLCYREVYLDALKFEDIPSAIIIYLHSAWGIMTLYMALVTIYQN